VSLRVDRSGSVSAVSVSSPDPAGGRELNPEFTRLRELVLALALDPLEGEGEGELTVFTVHMDIH